MRHLRGLASPGVALVGALTVSLVARAAVLAGPVALELDPAKTRIEFSVAEVFGTVRGTFKLKRAVVQFDPATGLASGVVVVDASSGESGNRLRDREMHHAVLESDRFRDITFTPSRIRGSLAPRGESRIEVDGTIELHGESHPLTLAVQVGAAELRLTADTRVAIPYTAWGLKNPSMLMLRVADTVDIHVSAEAQLGTPLETSK